MSRRIMTPEIAHACAGDAGDRSARGAGRRRWNRDDWNAAAAEYARLSPPPAPEELA